MASNLREEFPEVNQSTIHDLLKAYGNDKQKVANVLREMEDESKGTADKHKVDELRNLFPSIPVQDIQAVLASVNGNVEDAIVPLFSKHEELQKDAERKKEAERKKQWEEQARKRREEESRKQAQHLMDVFATIPKETIQQILDQNEGDLEETTSKLLAIVAEQEEAEHAKRRAEQEKRQKEEEKRLKVQALKEQLPDVDEKEIVAALTDSDWDLKRAISKVLHATNERLKAEMKGLFASITEEEIDNALFKANWVRAKTAQALSELVYKKELEKARQEKERLERERAEKARREAEELRARLEEQARQERDRLEKERLERERLELEKQARDAAEREALAKRLQEEARIKAEQDRLLREEEARLEAERLERERQERERIERERLEKERLERERAEQEQVKAPNLFEVSTMLGEKIENEIAELKTDLNDLQAQVNAEFITKLQLIIETQARNGTTPGVVPAPLPKQIDELLAQQSAEKPQVDDDRSQHLDEAPVATDKARPDEHPADSASSEKEAKCSVVLKAVPEVVDSANTITVTFEVVGGKSTASDWIGMFPAGQSHTRNYVTYEWRGKEEQKGTIQFTAPTVYGNYEFVYFYNRTYDILAKSNIVRVAPEIAVVAAIDEAAKVIRVKWNQVSGNTYSRPWIGLYEKSQPNNKSYLAWTYANKMEVTVPLPTKPKEYELRFFTNSYNDVARSNTVVIEGEDKLSAAIENKILVVRPNLVTVDPATDHVWIGIYPVVQPDNHQWTRYKNVPHPTNEITFKTPLKPGEYEVRLFANKTYDVVKRSNAFVVPPPQ